MRPAPRAEAVVHGSIINRSTGVAQMRGTVYYGLNGSPFTAKTNAAGEWQVHVGTGPALTWIVAAIKRECRAYLARTLA